MKIYSNKKRVFIIHFIIVLITLFSIVVFSFGFGTSSEKWIFIILIVLYIAGGAIFLEAQEDALESLVPFLIYCIGFSLLMSIHDAFAIIILLLNPIGFLLTEHCMEKIPTVLGYLLLSIFPTLLLYIGMIVKRGARLLFTPREKGNK